MERDALVEHNKEPRVAGKRVHRFGVVDAKGTDEVCKLVLACSKQQVGTQELVCSRPVLGHSKQGQVPDNKQARTTISLGKTAQR